MKRRIIPPPTGLRTGGITRHGHRAYTVCLVCLLAFFLGQIRALAQEITVPERHHLWTKRTEVKHHFHELEQFKDPTTGLAGLEYNGELLLAPQFERIEQCETLPYSATNTFFIVKQVNKFGVINPDGVIIPAEWDSISDGGQSYYYTFPYLIVHKADTVGLYIGRHPILPVKYKTIECHSIASGSSRFHAFYVEDFNGNTDVLDLEGRSLNYPQCPRSFDKRTEKQVCKKYKALCKAQKTPIEIKYFKRKPNSYNSERAKELKEDRCPALPYGYRSDEKFLCTLTPFVVNEDTLYYNDVGFVFTPLELTDCDKVLERDPYNLYAWLTKIDHEGPPVYAEGYTTADKLECCQSKIQWNDYLSSCYNDLAQMYSEAGPEYEKTVTALQKANNIAVHRKNSLENVAQSLEVKAAKEARRAARFDAITSALSAFADGVASVASTIQSQQAASVVSYTPVQSTTSSPKKSSSTRSYKPKYNISKKLAHDTDKYTYGRYESMVSKATYGGGEATQEEVNDWRDKMNKLKNKWGKDW